MPEPNDPLKDLHRQMFQRGQEAMALEQAAEEFEAQQGVTRKAAKLAAETLDLADQLGAGGDPHKERLAAIIKNTVIGAVQEHVTNPTASKAGRGPEVAAPFSESLEASETSLPGPSPQSTRALPQESPEPPKRKRGRPPKDAKA